MNRSRKRKRFSGKAIPLFMAAMVGVTTVPAIPAYAAQTADSDMGQAEIAENAEKYGLTENIEDGAILHCWCWSFDTIKENMADIAAAGFTSIQTSPANECNDTHPNMKLMGSDTVNGTDGCWWWHYQPTDWKIGNYQLGTRDDFEAMCDEADKYGIKVIVDVIPNHVTPELDEVSQDLYNAAGGKDNLFHANGFRAIQNGGDWSWGNRLACTTGEMGGLPDVNTENEGFQKYFMNYLNDLIECGADGFRYDTAKHIGVPSDPTDPRSPENDFWPVATGKESVDGVSLEDADRIFTYGEVLQGDNVPEKEYAQYMRMTASSYGGKLRSAVQGKNFSVNNIMNWQHSAPESLVTWVESHDTYCNAGESVGLSDTQIRLAWAVIAARQDGTPLFYSRPDGSNGWSNRWGKNVIGEKGNDQFKHPEVAAVNKFRNAMEGEAEYLRNINGSSEILQIDRGTSGTCIINLGGELDIDTATKMADGTYKDQVSGRTFTVSNGKIKGHLSKEAVAVIYKEKQDPVQTGTVSAEAKDGKTTFATETTEVVLHAENVTNATYSTTEGEKGSYQDGDVITVGKTLKAGESVTITVTGESKKGTVTNKITLKKTDEAAEEGNVAYINLPSGWDEPYAYVYSESTEESNAVWPGVKMEKAEADETNGYNNLYKYTVPDNIKDPLVIFYGGDNFRRYPGDMEQGMDLTGTMIYENGQWHEYKVPEHVDWKTLVTGEYDVYIKKPANWGNDISCYAYENQSSNNAAWPGVKMESLGEGVYAYNLPENWTDANIMFTDGKAQMPGSMQPGFVYEAGSSMLCHDGEWTVVEKKEDAPVITSSVEDGAAFDSESMDVTLKLEHAVSGTYSLDGGPAQEFKDSAIVSVGKGKIANTDITLAVTAKGKETTTEQTFTFHKDFNAEKNGGAVEYEVTKETNADVEVGETAAEALGGNYATNPNGQAGKNATIASAADFTADMLIAQGVANDDPRIFRGSHEGPVYDSYALYGAWDDTNIYLGWQFTNVTDVVDPAQGYPISDNGKPYNGDIPQMLALHVGSGHAGNGVLDTGGYVWGIDVGYETPIDTLICFSSKPGGGAPALFKTSEDGTFSYDTCVGLDEAGISYQYEDGFFGSTLTGIKGNGYDGYEPSMLISDSANWTDFLNEGHSTTQDTFYTMTIPMESLGITKAQLEQNGIGVMHISTFGASGIGSIPMDMTMLDSATEEYSQDASTSAEKEDTDLITVPLAKLGKAGTSGGGGDIETEKKTMMVNFGADRSAPQTEETDLTLKAETTGGEGTITYTFAVDGKAVENTTADSALWDTKGGTHTISVTAADEQGHEVTVEKEYDITGEVEQEKELKITSFTASKMSPQKPLTRVKFTAEAEGGSGKLQYRFLRVSKDGTEKVLKDFRNQNYVSCNPRKGTYTIRVEVKDEKGNTAEKEMQFTWK